MSPKTLESKKVDHSRGNRPLVNKAAKDYNDIQRENAEREKEKRFQVHHDINLHLKIKLKLDFKLWPKFRTFLLFSENVFSKISKFL